jgi:hypothetical protein
VQDLEEEEEGNMAVNYTSLPFPDPIEVFCLTPSYNPMLALPSGLVTS